MKITIIGAGAIGGTTGAYLAGAGYDVTLVDANAEHVAAMNQQGLRVTGCRGDSTFSVKALTPDQLRGPLEMVILSVKAHFTESALSTVAPLLSSDGFIAVMQNGLNEEAVAAAVGQARTVGCFIQFGADYLEPGHVQLAYNFPIWVGELDGKITTRAQTVAEILGHVMETVVTDNIWGYVWAKMCLCCLYFVGALTDKPLGYLFTKEDLRPVLRGVVQEAYAVANALGVRVEKFPGFDPSLFMATSTEQLELAYHQFDPKPRAADAAPRVYKPHTGMQRDIIVRKRRTEVDKQPGAVVDKGKTIGVPTPLNSRLVEMIHEIEDGKRQLGEQNIRELGASAIR
jgi:2-dehydropantoate 2-reductase